MVNPRKSDVGKEYVLLLNKSDEPVDLTGWKIADKAKNSDTIKHAVLNSGETLRCALNGKGAQLGNKGGIITLLNKDGLKVDGVSYTKKDASREGVLVEL
jgi:hypothetical protein